MKLFRKRSNETKAEDLSGGQTPESQPTSPLPPGTPAPDFSLPDSTNKKISVGDFRGQPLILAFYPADWSPVCGDQMVLYNEVLPLFKEHNAQLLGISVDNTWSHLAFSESQGLSFPLLSDFEPKGAIARAYGVYDAQNGVSQRALFVIDSTGIIRWSYRSPSNVNPGAHGILNALESLEE